MVTIAFFRKQALELPETEEQPHFEKTSFKVRKKIFATLSEEKKLATIKLSEVDQSVFCTYGKSAIYPVPNKWGKQGWTNIELDKVPQEVLLDALKTAYGEVVNKK